ncbi:MAG: methyltransferase domain-containing protein [bacterium]|nr:methyltransferase domain-containing protein [bacterium]
MRFGVDRQKIKAALPLKTRRQVREIYRFVRSTARRGGSVTCPCCGWSFRSFSSGGASPPRAALCTRCASLERHRWMWLYIQNHTSLLNTLLPYANAALDKNERMHLIHFAPEISLARSFSKQPHVRYTGVDLELTEFVGDYVNARMDVTCLGFSENTFDALICNHVLEHVEDDLAALREFHRILKPGGIALISVPVKMDQMTYEDPSITSPSARKRHFEQEDHVRVYGCDIVQRLQEAGFCVEVHSTRDIEPDAAARFGLWRVEYGQRREEIIFHCVKKAPQQTYPFH